ncbi:hypothetical protein B7494_g3532 [Chlorociboria aeruginascens]|nr:hypothetical protein B7494_g3532 [Chlorociboria aeruginascens]
MGSQRNSHMLIYQTMRPVKCLYFDGESATLFGTGQLDTQMLHIYGNASGPSHGRGFRGLYDEYARARGLCDWLGERNLGGLGWGFEGIVRMNAGFEMIVCNFSSPSWRLISHLNVTAPLLPFNEDKDLKKEDADPTSYFPLPLSTMRSDVANESMNRSMPPNWRRDRGREPFLRSQGWNWFVSGTAHYGSSGMGPGVGEIRVKPIICGFMNYYSPLYRSQATARMEKEMKDLNLTSEGLWEGYGVNGSRSDAMAALTRRRRAHTLGDVSVSDAATMKNNSERVLRNFLDTPSNCTGIDWSIMTNEIVQTYARNLAALVKTLKSYPDSSNKTLEREWWSSLRDAFHVFLVSFLEYPNTEEMARGDIWSRESTLFRQTYSRCRSQYTQLLNPEEGIHLNPEEELLKWAVEEITGEICSVTVDIGLSAEGIWDSDFNVPSKKPRSSSNSITHEITRWTRGVEELMAWLGWASEWIGCSEICAWDEKCYIPMWPLLGRGSFRRERPGRRGPGFVLDETDLWKPVCVKEDYIMARTG